MTPAKLIVFVGLFSAITAYAFAAPTDIVIDDQNVFPESMGAAPDGTLYIGGSATSRVYRALPGQAHATPWISKKAGDFHLVLGVLPDKASNTLWVCDNILADKVGWLKTFVLDTGKKKDVYQLPGGGVCNDIALRAGAAYISDTMKGRILKLAPGAGTLTVWHTQEAAEASLDGLIWSKDGKLYTNTYLTHHLIRVDVKKDGSAGKATVLTTDKPLFQPDGMRLSNDGRILMVEGQARPGAGLKEGRLDEVIVHGDSATIKVLKSGFELPVAVTPIGNTAWVLESKFDFQRNADLKGKDPGNFHAYAVPLGK